MMDGCLLNKEGIRKLTEFWLVNLKRSYDMGQLSSDGRVILRVKCVAEKQRVDWVHLTGVGLG
jgi:hypothetical protein